MKLKIEIEQIDNGFVVDLFDVDGKEEDDWKTYTEKWETVMDLLNDFHKEHKELEEKKQQ